jgi:RNA polymerase sigma-70 factor (ECF subfamily)
MPLGVPATPAFPETRWTVVLRAREPGNESLQQEALEDLCRSYWYPLYTFARRKGNSAHDSEDLVQGFFAEVLGLSFFAAAEREKGKLRTFLLSAFERFLVDDYRRQNAKKRGGAVEMIPFQLAGAEDRFLAETEIAAGPAGAFEKVWAMTVLEKSVARLAAEYESAQKSETCAALLPFLNVDEDARAPYDELSANLNISKAGARQAVHRFRERFRAILRREIADTLRNPTEALVDQELSALKQSIAS